MSTTISSNSTNINHILIPASTTLPTTTIEEMMDYMEVEIPNFLEKASIPPKGRKVLPIKDTPSIEFKKKKASLSPEFIKHHAFMRMQMFAIATITMWGNLVSSRALHLASKAKEEEKENFDVNIQAPMPQGSYNTDIEMEPALKNVDVKIGHARLNGSRGSHGRHASHCNAAAGEEDSVLKDLYQRTIAHGMTPMKETTFKAIGLSVDEINDLALNHVDEEFVQIVFKRILAKNKERGFSILGGTELEKKLNTTDELPAEFNLLCDGSLEKNTRYLIAQIYFQVLNAKINPIEATKNYCNIAQTHFSSEISNLQNKIAELSLKTNPNQKQIKKLKRLLKYNKLQLEGTKVPNFRYLIGAQVDTAKNRRKRKREEEVSDEELVRAQLKMLAPANKTPHDFSSKEIDERVGYIKKQRKLFFED